MGQQSQRASTIYCFILCSMANHSDQTFISPVFDQSDISSYLACYSVTEFVLTSHRMLRQKCITSITRKSNLGINQDEQKFQKIHVPDYEFEECKFAGTIKDIILNPEPHNWPTIRLVLQNSSTESKRLDIERYYRIIYENISIFLLLLEKPKNKF